MLTRDQFGFNAFWWEELHDHQQIESCVRCLAGIGYHQVEFKRDSFRQDKLSEQFELACQIATDHGLGVSNFVVLRDLVTGDDQGVEDVIETIRATSQAGVELLNCCFGGTPPPTEAKPEDWWMPAQPYHESGWDQLVVRLEKICAAAQAHDVTLVMEPTAWSIVCDFYSLQELFRRFDHPRLAITFDPSHFFLHRNDLPYAVRELGEKIQLVHVKDAIGVPGSNLDNMFPVLGAGAIDWVALFGALEAINYQGALSAEYEQFKYMAHVLKGDPEPAAGETWRAMNALFDLYQDTTASEGSGGNVD
jgi:sugar phosphate isomerase/epimerase